MLERGAYPLAQWRVYATAAAYYQRSGRRAEENRYWNASAAILTRLADSLIDAEQLRKSLLEASPVREIMARCERLN